MTSDDGESASAGEADASKKGMVGKVLDLLIGSKLRMMIAGGALLLLLGGGAGAYFLLGGEEPVAGEETAEAEGPIIAPSVAFYDIPDIIVNIQTVDGSPAYLKLGVSLEIGNAEEKTGLQAVMPRIVDQFQSYLRELRMDDLKGSAGVLRLKEELLRRINVAAAPYKIKDVLLKEMIVQ